VKWTLGIGRGKLLAAQDKSVRYASTSSAIAGARFETERAHSSAYVVIGWGCDRASSPPAGGPASRGDHVRAYFPTPSSKNCPNVPESASAPYHPPVAILGGILERMGSMV
jgi:hypothetical protein